MKIITITLTFQADKLPLDRFAQFLEFISEDIDKVEQKVRDKFPEYKVENTSMKVDDR